MITLRSLSLGIGSLLVASAIGCVHPTSMQIPLTWTPTNSTHEVAASALDAFHGKSVAVALGSDLRPEPRAKVGENREGSTPLPVTTQDDAAKFVRDHVAEILSQNAVQVVPSGAHRILRVDLKDFFVDEQETYQGRVTLAVTLKDGSGKTLWHGSAKGTNTRWGRSFAQDNYQQSLSDSTLDAVNALLQNPEFQKAVRGG